MKKEQQDEGGEQIADAHEEAIGLEAVGQVGDERGAEEDGDAVDAQDPAELGVGEADLF